MSTLNDPEKLYVISYLLHESNDGTVVGYADLGARILYLKSSIESADNISNTIANSLDELVEKTDDNQLKWDSLREFIESAKSDQTGSMFLDIKSHEKEPNEWIYRFESSAPKAILEDKIGSFSEREEALKQKIKNAAQVAERDLYTEIYDD